MTDQEQVNKKDILELSGFQRSGEAYTQTWYVVTIYGAYETIDTVKDETGWVTSSIVPLYKNEVTIIAFIREFENSQSIGNHEKEVEITFYSYTPKYKWKQLFKKISVNGSTFPWGSYREELLITVT